MILQSLRGKVRRTMHREIEIVVATRNEAGTITIQEGPLVKSSRDEDDAEIIIKLAGEPDEDEQLLCKIEEERAKLEGFSAPDGHRIKNALAFLKEHPELITTILTFVK